MSVDFSPGEHFVVPDDSSLNFTGGVSVSGWVMLNSVDGRKILSKQAGVSGGGYELGVLNSKFHFEIRTQAGVAVSNQAVSGGTTLSAGVLYFVVGVYDDATDFLATYVNGVLDRSLTTSEVMGTTDNDLKIGQEASDTTKVLFVGASVGPTTGADGAVMTHLETKFGASNVTYQQASTGVTGDMVGMDLGVLSSTPGSGDLRGKWDALSVPQMVWEEAIFKNSAGDHHFSSASSKPSGTDIDVVLDTHPIMVQAGLSNGDNTIFSSSSEMACCSGTIPAGTIPLAENPSTATTKCVVACEIGTADSDGGTFAGRRTNFPITDSSFSSLNAAGLSLFDACLDWLRGAVPWDGTMFDVRVYNKALSAKETQTMFAVRGSDSICNGLVARWRLAEGTASIGNLLLEDGFDLLLESGDSLLLEETDADAPDAVDVKSIHDGADVGGTPQWADGVPTVKRRA